MNTLRIALSSLTLLLAGQCASYDTSLSVSGRGYTGRVSYDGKTVTTGVDLDLDGFAK